VICLQPSRPVWMKACHKVHTLERNPSMTKQINTLRTAIFCLVFLSGMVFSCSPARKTAQPTSTPAKMSGIQTTMGVTSPTDTAAPPALTQPAAIPTEVAIGEMPPTPAAEVMNTAAPGDNPDILHGIAILGDSFYDEYRGSDRRGGEYAQVTYNLVELLVNLRDFNVGSWGKWDPPRREGYEYNWARSGDTSASLIRRGQHVGAAQQVREGKVTFVFIGIGANDFSPYYLKDYERIYSGEMTDTQLERKIQRAVNNVTLAVDTVLAAKPQGVAITLFTQWDLDPLLFLKYPNQRGRQRVADAIDAVNDGLRKMAAERNVVVVDQNLFGQEVVLPKMQAGFLDYGGVKVNFLRNGDNPTHARLKDGQHLGTIMSGLCANYYFIDTLNKYFNTNIPPLTEEEVLRAAGF